MGARRVNPLDGFLFLAAASHYRGANTQTFVQKALFCAEQDAVEGDLTPWPAFPFFRYAHGPYSKEAANTAQFLAERGFMEAKGGPLTPRGRRVLDEVRVEASKHTAIKAALDLVDKYASRFARMKLDDVLAEVYDRKVDVHGTPTAIKSVPSLTDLIDRTAPADLDDDLEQLIGQLGWRLSQTETEEKAEAESPLVSDERAADFLSTYLG